MRAALRAHPAPLALASPLPCRARPLAPAKVFAARPAKRRRLATAAEHDGRRYGQPVHATHPHLIEAGCLTPGIQASEYADRRRRLLEDMPEGAVVIVVSNRLLFFSQNVRSHMLIHD